MRVIALDPGLVTGWAIFQAPPKHREAGTPIQYYFRGYGQISPPCTCSCNKCLDDMHCHQEKCCSGGYHGNFYRWLAKQIGEPTDCTIVYEDFRNRAVAGARLDSLEYIGVIRLLGDLFPGLRLVSQGADIKTWASPAKLKRLDIGAPLSMMHARDAQRHLLYFLGHDPNVPPDLQASIFNALRIAADIQGIQLVEEL